jgi:hypothetical protein
MAIPTSSAAAAEVKDWELIRLTNRPDLSISERFAFAGGHEFGSSGLTSGSSRALISRSTPAHLRSTASPISTRRRPMPRASSISPAISRSCSRSIQRAVIRRLFFDYGNRGNKRMLQFFNDVPASNDPRSLADAGNGFLMRGGYTVVWLAWQRDLLQGNGRMLLYLPVARGRDGPLTGPVRVGYIANRAGITTIPLSCRVSVRSHPTVSLDPREARLTRWRYPYDERVPVPPGDWCFARVEGGRVPCKRRSRPTPIFTSPAGSNRAGSMS